MLLVCLVHLIVFFNTLILINIKYQFAIFYLTSKKTSNTCLPRQSYINEELLNYLIKESKCLYDRLFSLSPIVGAGEVLY